MKIMPDKLNKYKIYNMAEDETEYTVCLEHPSVEGRTLCGSPVGETPDGNPEWTDEELSCLFCLQTIDMIGGVKNGKL